MVTGPLMPNSAAENPARVSRPRARVGFNRNRFGEITVDAELLVPKLGLSTEALKAEMRKGNVSSVVETGIDEDCNFRSGCYC